MEMENKAKITASMRKGGSGIRPAIPKVEYFNITDIIFIIAAPIHPGTTGPTSASTSTNYYLKKMHQQPTRMMFPDLWFILTE